MSIVQRIRSGLQLRLGASSASSKGNKEDLSLEPDPVGEFLESKGQEAKLAEDRVSETAPAVGVFPQAEEQATTEHNENTASPEKITEVAQEEGSRMGSKIQSDAKSEAQAAVTATGEKKETDDAEAEAMAILAEAKLEVKSPVTLEQKVEASDPQPANVSQEEEKIESALEIFRSEVPASEITGSLPKALGDMSVYSLLEETKQIAQITKKVKKPRPK